MDDDEDDTCQRCGGEGFYHDCGDDTCCCADVDDPSEYVMCEQCDGSGIEPAPDEQCEACDEPFTDDKRPHVTADDVWLCDSCWEALTSAR